MIAKPPLVFPLEGIRGVLRHRDFIADDPGQVTGFASRVNDTEGFLAVDAKGHDLYYVGIDNNQITMNGDIGGKLIHLRKETTPEEHKELLDLFNSPAPAYPDYPMKN